MFLQDKNSWLIAIAAALVVSATYLFFASMQTIQIETNERKHIINIFDAFTKVYSDLHDEDGPIPATFRRKGMEYFSNSNPELAPAGSIAQIRMPGTPGLEIKTVELQPDVQERIKELTSQNSAVQLVDHKIEQGRLIGRTIAASVATNESCVTCHNDILGHDAYQIGDVMGAYVVETDLTQYMRQSLANAFFVFLLAFGGALLLARRERTRVANAVNALRKQVSAEKERRQAEAFASYLASHDTLTGLVNRKLFMDRLNTEIDAAQTSASRTLYTVLIDLDDFKSVNDKFGHDAGDAMLTAVANRIKAVFDPCGGLAARLGGDEFAAVAVSKKNGPSAEELGQTLVTEICKELEYQQANITPSVSIGIASIKDLSAPTTSSVMKAADMALYAAKGAGKRRYRIFDQQLEKTMGRRAAMREALPQAIADGEVRCVLQPQINLNTGDIVGFEALARWRWNGEDIRPDEFIGLAEDIGLIQQLDLQVLRQAASIVAEMTKTLFVPVRLSANLSTIDFRNEGVVESILDVLWETQLDPRQLSLEITESAILNDWEVACTYLKAMQEKNIHIALDDFGTGYSSLSYLTKFSFNTIKVDKGFVEALEDDADKRILLAHIIHLAEALGKAVIVEGVETAEQVDLLRDLGANIGQGFYFAKGLETDEAWQFLHDHTKGTKAITVGSCTVL